MASNRKSNGQFKRGSHWRQPQPHWGKGWLTERYLKRGMSAAEIATEAGCTVNNILHWLSKHNIPRRTISEARAVKHWGAAGPDNPMYGKCDEANPRWLGGVSPERQKIYSRHLWKELKKAVFARDEYKCRRCRKKPVGHRQLHTHHPKRWATHKMERFNIDNIITLCRKCHEFIHSKRNVSREFLES